MKKGQKLDENDKYFYCRRNLDNLFIKNNLILDISETNENYLLDIQLDE
jgi:hypothetical protein